MSSIDKGVEQVVNRLGRNVRVQKRGNTIYGIINGEVVFSLADRYGYINSQEEEIIRDGIRRYDEAVRRARIEAERQRLARLEEERVAEYRMVVNQIDRKRTQIVSMISRIQRSEDLFKASNHKRASILSSLVRTYPDFDFSELERENEAAILSQKKLIEEKVAEGNSVLAQFEKTAKSATSDLSTEKYRSLRSKISSFSIPAIEAGSAEYDNQKFIEKMQNLQSALKKGAPVVFRLKEYADDKSAIGVKARVALEKISSAKISTAEDFAKILGITQTALFEIKELIECENVRSDIASISIIEGEIAACNETYEIVGVSTYEILDFRKEIEELAQEAIEKFACLRENEFSTCTNERNEKATQRLMDILERGMAGEAVLLEVEKMKSEAIAYEAGDAIHACEYEEYKTIVQILKDYGVPSSEIEGFDARRYVEQKAKLTAQVAVEKREFERSRLIVTDMQAKSVMESMGFDLFSSIGDANGYVRESLFTKRGYDGVLWQVIVLSDGSVNRRIIGVNKGATETDVEYIKAVAQEMEKADDPQEFIKRLKEASGSELAVTTACEHDSENADAVIAQNGYHYLKGASLDLYNDKVAERKNEIQKAGNAKTAKRERAVVAGKAIANSSISLREFERKSRAMSHAN